MTVEQLVAILQKMPQDAVVRFRLRGELERLIDVVSVVNLGDQIWLGNSIDHSEAAKTL